MRWRFPLPVEGVSCIFVNATESLTDHGEPDNMRAVPMDVLQQKGELGGEEVCIIRGHRGLGVALAVQVCDEVSEGSTGMSALGGRLTHVHTIHEHSEAALGQVRTNGRPCNRRCGYPMNQDGLV